MLCSHTEEGKSVYKAVENISNAGFVNGVKVKYRMKISRDPLGKESVKF